MLAVAGRPGRWVSDASETYLKRLPRVWRTRVELISPSRKGGPDDAGLRQADEWSRLSRRVADDSRLVVLDERGAALASRELADVIAGWQRNGESVTFVIGGPDGVSEDCRERAALTLSLSAMTMPHELARVVLIEQLYRAHSIIEGHPYHRD